LLKGEVFPSLFGHSVGFFLSRKGWEGVGGVVGGGGVGKPNEGMFTSYRKGIRLIFLNWEPRICLWQHNWTSTSWRRSWEEFSFLFNNHATSRMAA